MGLKHKMRNNGSSPVATRLQSQSGLPQSGLWDG